MAVLMSEQPPCRLNWCPAGMAMRDSQGNITFVEHAHDQNTPSFLPEMPQGVAQIDCVYLPIESFLTRNFKLPLKHTRHLDADMLLQELADTADIEPDQWWLTWTAHKIESGISCMVFGIKKTIQQAIQSDKYWQQAPLLLVDGWERLNHWLPTQKNVENSTSDVAVIDTDAEGVFFGLHQNGAWQGMSRLNADMHDKETREAITQQVLWSLQAMGFSTDSTAITGRLTPETAASFQLENNALPTTVEESFPQRHMLNLMLGGAAEHQTTPLNIRHGQWAVRHANALPKTWHRTLGLSAAVCCLWLVLNVWNNHQLETQLETLHDEIITAFHHGLPNQPVIIDALAQLRQAAGGADQNTNQRRVTEQLQVISTVYAQTPWQMSEIKIDAKGVLMIGIAKNIDILNTIRDGLAEASDASVHIADTDLDGDKVKFRMRWL